MEEMTLGAGVQLRCFRDDRFKQGCLSIQFVRPMNKEEAAKNALLPAVLLRGTEKSPDIGSITARLDDLYGASVGPLVRRAGDWQTSGLFCGFIDDKYALDGDEVFAPMVEFLREILFCPRLEKGIFPESVVESEKKNLIATIESRMNDKRTLAFDKLIVNMCKADSFGIPRLGHKEDVAAITAQSLYAHYENLLKTARVELFYVGSQEPGVVGQKLKALFADTPRQVAALPEQTPFGEDPGGSHQEKMEVSQGKLAMGFVTPITLRHPKFAAMQLLNGIFGGGMTGKLFAKIREEMSLCYDIGSSYYSSKGILVVSAGIDFGARDVVEKQVEMQLEAICNGEISASELESARQMLLSSLESVHDTPGNIEGYYAVQGLTGMLFSREEYKQAILRCTASDISEVAKTLQKHTVFFLKGVQE
ncbi:MAG: insulinase family protein [Ruminococcaceae bacterium]|nr:insulinase family protein [Oscillospiraceae bacterium]